MRIKFKKGDVVRLKRRKVTGVIRHLIGDQVAVTVTDPEYLKSMEPKERIPTGTIKVKSATIFTNVEEIEHVKIEKKEEWADLWDESAKKN